MGLLKMINAMTTLIQRKSKSNSLIQYFDVQKRIYDHFGQEDLPLVNHIDYFWKFDDFGIHYGKSKKSVLEDDYEKMDSARMDPNNLYFIDGCMIGIDETEEGPYERLLVFDTSKEVK